MDRGKALADRDVLEPSDDELAGQLRNELAVSRHHLRSMLSDYWDRDWRRRHKGLDQSAEDHLWRRERCDRDLGRA
jgi:hypothetical protein